MDPADAHACRAAHCRLAVWPPAHRFSQCCIEWPVAVLLGRIDEKGTCQSWLRLPRRHLSPSGRRSNRGPAPACMSSKGVRWASPVDASPGPSLDSLVVMQDLFSTLPLRL